MIENFEAIPAAFHLNEIPIKHWAFLVTKMLQLCSSPESLDFSDSVNSFYKPFHSLQIWFLRQFQLLDTMPAAFHFSHIFVDEAQDLNASQIWFLEKLVSKRKDSRCFIFGDKNQAIYAFRGAESNSFLQLSTTLSKFKKVTNLSLSVSFRCPKSHVQVVQKLEPQISSAPNAVVGGIYEKIPEFIASQKIQTGDMVYSRINLPMIKFAYSMFLGVGKKIVIVGEKDIREDMLKVIESYLKKKNPPPFYKYVREEEEREKKLYYYVDQRSKVAKREEFYEALSWLSTRHETVEKLKTTIETLFSEDEKDAVIFSTVHKAKGRQSNNVWILDPYSFFLNQDIPRGLGKSEKDDAKTISKWQEVEKEQLRNLVYVALTRSKKNLNIVDGELSVLFQACEVIFHFIKSFLGSKPLVSFERKYQS
jgi:DNA helicase-2/ATP-dependent DNA helicase PcrA